MWRCFRNIVRMLVILVLAAAFSRAERYGLHDNARRDTQARKCCGGLEEGHPLTEVSTLNRVALYAGDDAQSIPYIADFQTAVDLAGLNEPLVLFTCGAGMFLVASVFKRKLRNSAPAEYVSANLSLFESESVNPEPVISAGGEQWGLGDRGAS